MLIVFFALKLVVLCLARHSLKRFSRAVASVRNSVSQMLLQQLGELLLLLLVVVVPLLLLAMPTMMMTCTLKYVS